MQKNWKKYLDIFSNLDFILLEKLFINIAIIVCCASQELCLSLYTNNICVKSLLAQEIYKLAAFIILQQFSGKEQSLFAVGNVLTTISYSF